MLPSAWWNLSSSSCSISSSFSSRASSFVCNCSIFLLVEMIFCFLVSILFSSDIRRAFRVFFFLLSFFSCLNSFSFSFTKSRSELIDCCSFAAFASMSAILVRGFSDLLAMFSFLFSSMRMSNFCFSSFSIPLTAFWISPFHIPACTRASAGTMRWEVMECSGSLTSSQPKAASSAILSSVCLA